MKKTRNIILIISVMLVIIGMIICGVSFAMAGFNAEHFSDAFIGKEVNLEMAEYNAVYGKISINVIDREVELKRSTDDKIHITYKKSEKSRMEFTESGNTLAVTEYNEKKWFDYIFNFDFGRNIVIELPEKINADIKINDKNGKMTANDLNVNGNFDIETGNGELSFINTKFSGSLTARTSNGKITLENLSVGGDGDFTTSNGKYSLEKVKIGGKLKLDTSNGKIKLNSVSAKEAQLKTSNGYVELEDVETEADVSVKSSNGGVLLNSVKAEEIDVKTSNGAANFSGVDVDKSVSIITSNGKISGTLVGKPGDFNFEYGGKTNLPPSGGGDKTAYFETSNNNIEVDYE